MDRRLRELTRSRTATLVVVVCIALAVAAVQGNALRGHSTSTDSNSVSSYHYSPYGQYMDLGWPVAPKPCCLRDANGIPLYDYHGTIGRQYNPFDIAADGLIYFSSARFNGEPIYVEQAVRDANWLVRHQDARGRWLYHFPLVEYGLKPPWPSGLAQGYGMSLLVRVWRYTGDARYLASAKRALRPFSRPAWKGGVLTYWGNLPFYDEAPSRDHPPYILNGFMSALIGLHDTAVAAPRSGAQALYKRGIKTLETLLPLYDFGHGQTVYNLQYVSGITPKQPASTSYEGRHVADLRTLESITPSPTLRHYLALWSVGNALQPTGRAVAKSRFERIWRNRAVRSLVIR